MLTRLIPDTVDPDFLVYSLRDSKLMDRVQDKPIGSTVEHLRVGGIETLLMPLPSINEQRRIVAKVRELMLVCDELEISLATEQTQRTLLLDGLLRDAFEGPSPAAWA